MPIDLGEVRIPDEIPGYITHFELLCLSNIARHIPENKKILEIGSLFGRSANTLLLNSHKSVTMTAIDNFLHFGDIAGWEAEHADKLDGCDPDAVQHALELTRKTCNFYAGFNYFTQKYQENGRLKLLREDSQEADIDHNVEFMFIDGNHFIVLQDYVRFFPKVDGLIAIHDYEVETEWGQATIKSCMGCSYMTEVPYVIFPSASIAFFCKSEYWRNLIYKICADSLKQLKEFGKNYEISKFFA